MTTWSRAGTHLSPAQFRAFEAGYLELVHRHAQRVDETPPGSRPVRIRWYAYPEPADEEDDER